MFRLIKKHMQYNIFSSKFLLPVLCALSLAGCSSFEGFPDYPVSQNGYVDELNKKFFDPEKPFGNYYAKGNTADDQLRIRNEIIAGRMLAFDIRFNQYRSRLHRNGVSHNALSNSLVLTLDALGTAISGGASQVLSAVSGGVSGIKTTVDKDLFFEKTMSVLMQEMESGRKKIKVRILKNLQKPLEEYSLQQGLSDLEDYYFAGTIPGALSNISAQSGQEAQEADKALNDLPTNTLEKTENLRNKHLDAVTQMTMSEMQSLQDKLSEAFPEKYRSLFAPIFASEKSNDADRLREFLKITVLYTHDNIINANKYDKLISEVQK